MVMGIRGRRRRAPAGVPATAETVACSAMVVTATAVVMVDRPVGMATAVMAVPGLMVSAVGPAAAAVLVGCLSAMAVTVVRAGSPLM